MEKFPTYCSCCGFPKQEETLGISTRLSAINNIGISTYLYFQTIKNVVIQLVILTLVYSIYSLASNMKASENYDVPADGVDTTFSWLKFSIGSKQANPTTANQNSYIIQCWLGVAVVIIWTLALFCMKYTEKSEEVRV